MKKINVSYMCILCAMIYGLSSCKKFVMTDGPKNQLTAAAVFADSLNADAAITGIYSQMAGAGFMAPFSGGMTVFTGLSADELTTTSADPSVAAFYNNNILNANSYNLSFYNLGYKFIYSANACIEGLNASSGIPDHTKLRLIAECKFLRAFCYFYLVNLYGQLPVVLSTDQNQTRIIPRSSTDIVFGQIIADLKYAQENMPVNSLKKERAGYYAATALLAKTYLYTSKYALAIPEADKVISSGNYSLVTDLNGVFLAASNETIWNTPSVVLTQATYEGLNFIPSGSTTKPRYILTASLYNSFEPGDKRKSNWTKANTVSGVAYPYPFKYKVRTTTTTPAENYVISRLAEVYLTRAEAKANQDDLNGAKSDLNVIRNRAGLPSNTATDRASLLIAIENERKSELFCEWGNRWLDLKRTNRALTVLGTLKPNINQNMLLYPIPLSELNANPYLSQNPGY